MTSIIWGQIDLHSLQPLSLHLSRDDCWSGSDWSSQPTTLCSRPHRQPVTAASSAAEQVVSMYSVTFVHPPDFNWHDNGVLQLLRRWRTWCRIHIFVFQAIELGLYIFDPRLFEFFVYLGSLFISVLCLVTFFVWLRSYLTFLVYLRSLFIQVLCLWFQ